MPTIHRNSYSPPDYLIETIDLTFDIYSDHVLSVGEMYYRLNQDKIGAPLILNGKDLNIISIYLDGNLLSAEQISVTEDADSQLYTIHDVPANGKLIITTKLDPWNNKSCVGLYISHGTLVTKCESEYFRRIMLYIDRPDNLAKFSTTIIADESAFPVLLSNGNKVAAKQLSGGRHCIKFVDPFPKPCYLFALVAGNLAYIADTYVSRTIPDKKINLFVYTQEKNLSKVGLSMQALKEAMQWEEDNYGLVYDLDHCYLVGVQDYNAGATENKGLLVFNDSYLLSDPKLSTDANQKDIYAVIAHELFHNYAGNRVTIRSWFQLALKEGLATMKEDSFSGDRFDYHENRIETVNRLRSSQFPQDASALAHAVCPEQVACVRNIYTVTTYYKGAELFKMLSLILTRKTFEQGTKKFFADYDGTAAVIEDFIRAQEQISGVDLQQFLHWFYQAGTPELFFAQDYDQEQQKFTLHIKQRNLDANGNDNLPLMIPISIGLLDSKGNNILTDQNNTRLLILTGREQSFEFDNISEVPVLSLLRDFSAPVNIKLSPVTIDQNMFLFMHDTDPLNRWQMGQEVIKHEIYKAMNQFRSQRTIYISQQLLNAFGNILCDKDLTPSMKALLLTVPSVDAILAELEAVDLDALIAARTALHAQIALVFANRWLEIYLAMYNGNKDDLSADAVARRSLQNLCLRYLICLQSPEYVNLCYQQFSDATNMTNQFAAFKLLVIAKYANREDIAPKVLHAFQTQWCNEPLALAKWISIQAQADSSTIIEDLIQLSNHSIFDRHNPDDLLRLYGTFAESNLAAFHNLDGSGYAFIADAVLQINQYNPEVAEDLLNNFANFKKFDLERRSLMIEQLQRIKSSAGLKENCRESVEKILATVTPDDISVTKFAPTLAFM